MFLFQEHVVRFVVKLLSPPIPPGYTGPRSHLVDHMPMLTAIFFGASSVDTVHILSLHGLVSEIKYCIGFDGQFNMSLNLYMVNSISYFMHPYSSSANIFHYHYHVILRFDMFCCLC